MLWLPVLLSVVIRVFAIYGILCKLVQCATVCSFSSVSLYLYTPRVSNKTEILDSNFGRSVPYAAPIKEQSSVLRQHVEVQSVSTRRVEEHYNTYNLQPTTPSQTQRNIIINIQIEREPILRQIVLDPSYHSCEQHLS